MVLSLKSIECKLSLGTIPSGEAWDSTGLC
jgi:hypothetical protein